LGEASPKASPLFLIDILIFSTLFSALTKNSQKKEENT
jgi:hypothetical protein